jgi:hypothetical protein
MKKSRLQIVAVSGAFVALIMGAAVATFSVQSCTKEETKEYPEEVLSAEKPFDADSIVDNIHYLNVVKAVFDEESLKLYAPNALANQKSLKIPFEVRRPNSDTVFTSGYFVVIATISPSGRLFVSSANCIGNASLTTMDMTTMGRSHCFKYFIGIMEGEQNIPCTPQDPASAETYCLTVDGQPNITEPTAVWIYSGER